LWIPDCRFAALRLLPVEPDHELSEPATRVERVARIVIESAIVNPSIDNPSISNRQSSIR
jgi:hypothetical protein